MSVSYRVMAACGNKTRAQYVGESGKGEVREERSRDEKKHKVEKVKIKRRWESLGLHGRGCVKEEKEVEGVRKS